MSQPRYGRTTGDSAPADLASWGRRAAATVVDALLVGVVLVPAVVFALTTAETIGTDADGNDLTGVSNLGLVVLLAAYGWTIGFQIWNRWIRQGRTGQSVGKQALGIRLLSEQTMQPPGAGTSFRRDVYHVTDGLFVVGFLWPLWDPKRQTFADKLLGTVVVTD